MDILMIIQSTAKAHQEVGAIRAHQGGAVWGMGTLVTELEIHRQDTASKGAIKFCDGARIFFWFKYLPHSEHEGLTTAPSASGHIARSRSGVQQRGRCLAGDPSPSLLPSLLTAPLLGPFTFALPSRPRPALRRSSWQALASPTVTPTVARNIFSPMITKTETQSLHHGAGPYYHNL